MQRVGAIFVCVLAVVVGCVALAPVAEAGWLPPVAISEPSEHTGVPHVVLDSAGNATAVWDRWNGAETVVEAAFRPAGEGWEAPVDLSEPELPGEVLVGPGNGQAPKIAVDGAGDVTVVWEGGSVGTTFIEAVERPAGGAWTAPVAIGEMPTASNPEPWVAVDSAGDAIAVWKKGEVIQSAYRPVGEPWEAPIAVSGEESFVPQAAMNAAGDATVVWMHHDGGHYVVKSAFRPAGGEWESPTLVSRPGEEGGDPQISLDAAGDTLVAWRGEDEGTEYVRTSFRPAGEPWEVPTDASRAGEEVQSIVDAVDPAGNAIVAWSGDGRNLGEYGAARAAFRPSGGAWGEPTDLQTEIGNGFPTEVTFDQSGNAAIVWERETTDGSAWIVEAAYRPAAGEWEASTALSEAGEDSYDPVVVLDAPGDATAADGDATAAWVSETRQACEGSKGPPQPECRASTVETAGYDPQGASVELELPSSAEVGEPVSISMTHASLFSPKIDFGDGAGVAGLTAVHIYDEPGEYAVSGEGAEVLGYAAASQRMITIVPEGTGGEPGDSTPSGPTGGVAGQETTPSGSVGEPADQGTVPATTGAGTPGPVSAGRPGGGVRHLTCQAARARVRADRRRLKSAPSQRLRSELKKARRRVTIACPT